jgi:hypothetical protein
MSEPLCATFSTQREEEFLTKVQDARIKLADFKLAMRHVRLTVSKEEEIEDFAEDMADTLCKLERSCLRNLKGRD